MRKIANNNPLAVVLFTVFLDLVGVGIIIPVIPILLADPSGQFHILPSNMPIETSYIILGLLIAIYPFMQFFSSPILGQLSDRVGRKKVLVVCLIGTCLSYALFAIGILTKNLPLLFFSRAVDGFTGGNISVAQAVIADITAPEKRAKTFGLVGAAFGLGFIIGPYIGGKLSDPAVVSFFDASTPFWFAAILSAINIALLIWLLPETNKSIGNKAIDFTKSIHNITKAFTHKELRLLFFVAFLLQCGFSFFVTFFSVFLISKFAFTQGNIGDFFAYVGIWIVISQVIVTRKVSQYFPEHKVLRVSLFAVGVFVFTFLLPTYSWQLLLVVPPFAIFNALTMANMIGLISRSANQNVQGEVLGLNASIQALAQSIPPVIAGIISASFGVNAPVIVSSILICLAGVIFISFYKPVNVQKAI